MGYFGQNRDGAGVVDGQDVFGPMLDPEVDRRLRGLSHILYALYALSWFTGGISGLVALIIDYVKRPDTRGTLYASHFTWRIRTFWWSLLAFVVATPFLLIHIGWLFYFATWIWGLYRVIKGWLRVNDRRPVP